MPRSNGCVSPPRAGGALLLVAADRREFSGFENLVFRPQAGLRCLAAGELNGVPALFAANGVGRRAAAAAVRAASGAAPLAALVSVGFAGALAPDYRVGDVFIARRVLSAGVEYAGGAPGSAGGAYRQGALLTVDRVVQSAEEKRRLAASGAQAVDMEAAGVAEAAAERSLPFYCVRVVSDAADAAFPIDFNRALRRDGSFSAAAIVRQAGWSRARWRQLARLKRDGERAARSLAAFLATCEFAR